MKKLRLSNEEMSAFFTGLEQLAHAGIGTADCLGLMAEDEDAPEMKALLNAMEARADEGASLAAAMRESGCFEGYACALVEAGLTAGRLEQSLAALADYYDEKARLSLRLRSALLYPAVLLLIMLVVVTVLLVSVLPIFNEVYAQLGGSLTGLAGGLLAFGEVLDRLMPLLCVLLALIVVFLLLFFLRADFREKLLLLLWRRRFGDKGASRSMNEARFAQGLAMGLASGLSDEESLNLAAALVEDVPAMKERCDKCRELLDGSATLPRALIDAALLPRAECRLLDAALRSGTGDAVMAQIAGRMHRQSNNALDSRVSRVEPALVLIASVLVGVILLAVMLPLMNIMTAVG